MAAVQRLTGMGCYTQTGFVQRGLGFGWRLNDLGAPLDDLRPFFRLMPVSVGVVFLTLDPAENERRNHARKLNPATAHEDRSFMVALMRPAIAIAQEELRARGVPVLDIDTALPVDLARAQLLDFASQNAGHAPSHGPDREVAVLPLPDWWR